MAESSLIYLCLFSICLSCSFEDCCSLRKACKVSSSSGASGTLTIMLYLLLRKGKAKAAELERLNRDRERRRDSINRVQIERERKEEEARRKEVDEKLAAKIKEAKLAKTAELKAEFENIAEELGTVYYEFNSPGLTDELKELLDAMAKVMAQEPRFMIKVIAHTDSRGDSEYNDWLSNKRAVNAKSYLESKGISPARITSEGAGERKLVNKCSDGVPCTRDEHSRNRRTEVIFNTIPYIGRSQRLFPV